MASATNPTPPTNLPTTSVQSAPPGQKDASSRQQSKPGGVKATDRGRKESPVDQGRIKYDHEAKLTLLRRASAQKAWTTGNPLTSRGATPVQTNGNSNQAKTMNSSKISTQKENGLSDKHSHDRLRFILGGAVGLPVVFTTKSGDKFEGLLAGSSLASNNSKVSLKMTKKVSGNTGSQTNGVVSHEAALVGTSPEHAMTFDLKDMADLSIPQFNLPETSRQVNGNPPQHQHRVTLTPAGTASTFQTDSDISANVARGNERVLQKWVPDGPDTTDVSLDSGNIGHWDQFAAHKQRFGDSSAYDENMYTTTINRNAPDYKQRAADANRKAQEILSQSSSNAHIREERGLALENDYADEEDKYSGVARDAGGYPALSVGGPNRYIPPAARAPTAQATVPGVPVDSAIISAQLSKPDKVKAAVPKVTTPVKEVAQQPNEAESKQSSAGADVSSTVNAHNRAESSNLVPNSVVETTNKSRTVNTSLSPQRKVNPDNPTEHVEAQVLDAFHKFAAGEKERVMERKRAHISQDRTAKINDLLRFSKTFKLKTPIPTDLVGILAKDPAKQEAIIEKAQKEHEQAKSSPPATVPSNATPSATAANKTPAIPKFDASQVPPPIPDRANFTRGRGGFTQPIGRNDRAALQQSSFGGRGSVNNVPRNGAPQQDRRSQAPAPVTLAEGRTPPIGPMADQHSPQRSHLHTPTSAGLNKLNVKALEFRPNINAPTFAPAASSIAPSSPASIQRTTSESRAPSPSSFFGARKPRSPADRSPILTKFNSVKRMREEIERRKTSGAKTDEPVKDYPHNGGIPNAYHTGPVWLVKAENQDKTYLNSFGRPGGLASPAQSRNNSNQQVPYLGQLPLANGSVGVPQISTPQHGPHGAGHQYLHQYDDQRAHIHGATPQVYPSPGMAPRQMSNFSSPMGPQAQLAYGQPQYFGGPGQIPIQMRPYPSTPGMMQAQPGQITAPMMVQQQSSGPYMAVPQHYNQMQMYSPSGAHVYPQPNGFPSPGRMAPMMMHQGSQQSHHSGQQIMYGFPGQGGPATYQQQQQGQINIMRGNYGGPYGAAPHQPLHMQQRAMSSGYGKGIPQAMQQNSGPPANAPQQPAAFNQLEMGIEDTK